MQKNKPIVRLALTAMLSEPALENNTQDVLHYFSNGRALFVVKLELKKALKNGFSKRI